MYLKSYKELKFAEQEDFVQVDQLLEEVLKMLNKMTSNMKQLNANR